MKITCVWFTFAALLVAATSAQDAVVGEESTKQQQQLLNKEEGDYWSRLLQETDLSVAPTPPAPTPTEPAPTPTEPAPTPTVPATPTPTIGAVTPTDAPPTESPPTEASPTEASPTVAGPTESAPTEGAPTEGAPTEAGPTEAGPTEAGPTGNIVEILAADARFTTLVELVVGANLDGPLEGEGPLTVFAPTNEAFDALGLQEGADVTEILLHHVVGEEVPLVDGLTFTTLNGEEVTLMVTESEVIVNGGTNEANISETIQASNGVIHVIDAVLIPPASGGGRRLRNNKSG